MTTTTADQIFNAAAAAAEAQYNADVDAGDRRLRGEHEWGGMLYRSHGAMIRGMVAEWLGGASLDSDVTDEQILIGLADAGWADGRMDADDVRRAIAEMRTEVA